MSRVAGFVTQVPSRMCFVFVAIKREHGIRFEPEDMRIEDPAILEAGRFGLARERDDPVDGHVGLDGDAEAHGLSSRGGSESFHRQDAEIAEKIFRK